tara:strand:- start:142 stop:1833 length:1692 start_codon:yes stop_codon:yes gene_type:complete
MEENKFLITLDLNNKSNFSFDYQKSSKFSKDKIFVDKDDYLYVFDGVALNKNDLLKKSQYDSWQEYIIASHRRRGESFFKEIKGSYFGVIFNKVTNELIAYSDHISSKPLFYYHDSTCFIISNNCYDVVQCLKNNNIDVSLNETAAYFLLSYGFPIEDLTIIENIKRLLPGCYLLFGNKVEVKEFFKFSNQELVENQSDDEIIENIDRLFRAAIKAQFDKDIEYNYKHLVALSGGLDSRMTSWVAHDMGYTDQLNFTFSQSNYLDETIPKKIASDLKHEWIFSFLDNGLFLKDVDEITKLTGGNVLYYGLAHGNRMLKKLNTSLYGIIHSGQLGDVILGTYNETENQNENYKIGDGAYSKTYLDRIKNYQIAGSYNNQEMFKLYTRGFIGTNYGLLVSQKSTETHSPFYDIDFLTYCLSIPIKKRLNHGIYKMWVKQKYPEAGDYIWEKTGEKVNNKLNFKIKGKTYSTNQLYKFFLKKTIYRFLKFQNYGISSKKHMNPIDYWFRTNSNLEKFYLDYLNKNIIHLNRYPDLKKDVLKLNKKGSSVERVQILSLLSIAKMLSN